MILPIELLHGDGCSGQNSTVRLSNDDVGCFARSRQSLVISRQKCGCPPRRALPPVRLAIALLGVALLRRIARLRLIIVLTAGAAPARIGGLRARSRIEE